MRDSRPTAPIRVTYLDGLRGIASLQVLALHYLTAYLPALGQTRPELARHGWEHWFIHTPLFYLADGFASVNVFFLISGSALTFAFARHPFAIPTAILRRVVRLGLPMAASMVLAFGLFALFPTARLTAGHLIGEGAWLHLSGPPHLTFSALSWEMLEGLFLGHLDLPGTLLPHDVAVSLGLTPVAYSFNGPIWTLHIEFAGSLLVMALAALRSWASQAAHLAITIALLVLLIAHPLGLFVLGHLLARLTVAQTGRRTALIGALLFCAGVACAAYSIPDARLAPLVKWTVITNLPASFNTMQMQSALEAMLVFAGVGLCYPLRAFLACGLVQIAGRLSFSLYLVHFPILLTVSCLVFTRMEGLPGASAVAILAGLAVTFPVAWAFERLIDRTAIAVSHAIRFKPRYRTAEAT